MIFQLGCRATTAWQPFTAFHEGLKRRGGIFLLSVAAKVQGSSSQRADQPIRGVARRTYAGTMINRTLHLNFQCAVPPASLGAYLIAW
jgi:hypothetical protein